MVNNRPDWDSYFIKIAQTVAERATCLRRRYGAVIVKDHVIVSTGYNGACRGEPNCIDEGFCRREALGVPKGERYELCVAVHAEQNAIINGDPEKMSGGTIYVAGFNVSDGSIAAGDPCMLCRRMIKNARIARVVCLNRDGTLSSMEVEKMVEPPCDVYKS